MTVNSIDDLPQRPSSHDTEEAASIAFHAAIGASNYFLVQNKVLKDYGVDFWIEARDGEAMTNIAAHIHLNP